MLDLNFVYEPCQKILKNTLIVEQKMECQIWFLLNFLYVSISLVL